MARPGRLIPALQTERWDQRQEKGFIYQPRGVASLLCTGVFLCSAIIVYLPTSHTPRRPPFCIEYGI